jgi:hypothetical protein
MNEMDPIGEAAGKIAASAAPEELDAIDALLDIVGAPYFRTINGQLRRAMKIQLPKAVNGPVQVQISGGGETVQLEVIAVNGKVLACGLAAFDREMEAQAVVESSTGRWEARGLITPCRPWTIYVAQDKHLDYGWIHPVEQVVERLNLLTDFALDHDMRWNFDSSIGVEEYLRARPGGRGEQLLEKLRLGEMEVAANWLVPSPGLLSVEEMIRLLGYAHLLRAEGVPVKTTLMQEAPSLSWGMASVLAGAGLRYLVKGAYDLRNPHLKERTSYPLAWFEGPDGQRVLLRWDMYADTGKWGGYGEGWIFWKSASNAERAEFIEQTAARYEAYEHYPFNAILLAGTGFDEFPQTTAVSDFIGWFNAQGWDYPRLVDATWGDFWRDVETQLDPEKIPVLRGDFGTAWEEWPAQIARLSNLYRHARQTVFTAQTQAALAQKLDPASGAGRAHALEQAWRGLLQFAEHDFGGISADYQEDVFETKAGYAHAALREGTRALESGVATLAARLPRAKDGRALVVANPNNWRRGGVVEVVVHEAASYEVMDAESGQAVPCQLETRGPGWMQHYLSFTASDVPGFGYRTYLVCSGTTPMALTDPIEGKSYYENESYRLFINTTTGGLDSLYDKRAERELVLRGSHALNEFLHHSDGRLIRSKLESISLRHGPLCDHLITEVTNLRAKLRTTYKLYHASATLEIINDLYKEPSSEPQAGWFAFPFNSSEPQYHYDGMAAILRPGLQSQGGDLLPGSGLSSTAVQSLLAVDAEPGQIVLATPDAYLFQFGEGPLTDPSGDSDPHSPLALSLAMHNITRNDFLVRQGGQEYFTFRYRIGLQSQDAPSQAVQFAAESAQGLPRAWVTGGDDANLPLSGSFVSVTPENVIVTGFKVAEDGRGWMLRLWECDGHEIDVTIDARGLGVSQAWVCDLLEWKQEALAVTDGRLQVTLPTRGLGAIRME